MTEGKWTVRSRSANIGVIVFGIYVAVGVIYIASVKLTGLGSARFGFALVTVPPLLLMSTYAAILAFSRYLYLRDDQAGDNLYYLGFLYTLTSLGVSLAQFSASENGEQIVSNFGIAISSTILGVAFRVIFNQMRQDPAEVERVARIELAESARLVKQELDGAVFEFSSFRRTMQQSLEEAFREINEMSSKVAEGVYSQLAEFPQRSIAQIEAASKRTSDALEKLSKDLMDQLGRSGKHVTSEEELLGAAATKVRDTLQKIQEDLRGMKSPEGIIEIKLAPFVDGLSKALREHAKSAAEQTDQMQSVIEGFGVTIKAVNESLQSAGSLRAPEKSRLFSWMGGRQ